jgi:hypothetical protein
MPKRRPPKPGRKRDTFDRLNEPIPTDKKDTSLIDKFAGFHEQLNERIAKNREEKK